MASYGFERVSSDDDLEEPRKEKRPSASPFNLSSSSYPATSRKSRREGSSKKPKPHEMKMVELKRNDREHEADDRRGGTAAWHQQQQLYYNNNPNNNHNYNDYDQQPQHYARPMEMDGGHAGQYRGPADFMEAATNAAAALGGQIRKMTATHPRRDYLYEGHGNERDHLLVPPTSPRYRPHSPSLTPPSSAPSQSSATTFATFTTTTTSVTYSSSSSSTFYSSSSALYDPAASSPLLSSPSSFVSLATSPPTMLLLPPPPPPLKSPNGKNKKRVTWVDESMVGTQLEEVIEVERYLKQRGSLGWWAELVWDNKPYFLLLLVIALLFLASVVFIVYKLVF